MGDNGKILQPGGIEDSADLRDFPYEGFVGYGVQDIPDRFDIEEIYGSLTQKDQKDTLGCGGFATAYYSEILERIDSGKFTELSPRSIYAFTHLSGGGSITRDNIKRQVEVGIAPETAFSSQPMVESHLQSTSGWNEATGLLARRYKGKVYATMTDRTNFDLFCNAIYNGHGVVSGVNLSSEGWYSDPIRPPRDGEKIVGHILYFKGYDTTDPDPQKHYIVAKDSYPSGDKKLYRNYFEAGMVHSAWVIIDEPSEHNMWDKVEVIKAFFSVLETLGHPPVNQADINIHSQAATPQVMASGFKAWLQQNAINKQKVIDLIKNN